LHHGGGIAVDVMRAGRVEDEAAIRRALDSCLIGPEQPKRFDADAYAARPDPFPRWKELG